MKVYILVSGPELRLAKMYYFFSQKEAEEYCYMNDIRVLENHENWEDDYCLDKVVYIVYIVPHSGQILKG